MYVGLKQPRGDGERCVTPARAAAKETTWNYDFTLKLYSSFFFLLNSKSTVAFINQKIIV